MFSKEFLDVFLPCFAALWLICCTIAFFALPTKYTGTGKKVPLYKWLIAVLWGPVVLGIILKCFIEKVEGT